ncbi:MAG: GxxExxY protein [Salinivirgaceae bacterium]
MTAQINSNNEYPFKEECYKIIGCCMEVHNELGCGFLEAVYQEALEIVLQEKKIPFEREKVLDIEFRGSLLVKKYIADFICFNEVIVELKAADGLTDIDLAQVLNYLKATKKKIGLLVNFGATKLQYKRVIL